MLCTMYNYASPRSSIAYVVKCTVSAQSLTDCLTRMICCMLWGVLTVTTNLHHAYVQCGHYAIFLQCNTLFMIQYGCIIVTQHM